MGYTTEFKGAFYLDKPLTKEHAQYLLDFADTRRFKRDPKHTPPLSDPSREDVNLPIGEECGYYVGNDHPSTGEFDYNIPPSGQPGLWCQWVPGHEEEPLEEITEELPANSIVWNGGEKFYEYIPWIVYIVEHFLKPWGYVLNGEVEYFGERREDYGTIVCEDNEITDF